MRRMITVGLVGWLLTAAFALPPQAGPPLGRPAPVAAQDNTQQGLLAEVNAFRAANGRPPLEAHPALMAAAQGHATWMAVNYTYSHLGAGDTMPQDRAAAQGYQGWVRENVAGATLNIATVTWAVQGWASSQGHRDTMLSNATHAGTGIAHNDEQMQFVLLVGSSSGPAPRFEYSVTTDDSDNPDAADTGDTEAETDAEPPPPAPVVVPVVPAAPREDGSIVHVIQQGQTLWDLSAVYDVPLDNLLAVNHLRRGAVLHPGDEVIVRLADGQEPPPPSSHVVQEGESLWSVAAQHGLTLDELLAINGLRRGAVIRPGDELLLWQPEPTPTPTATSPSPENTPTAEWPPLDTRTALASRTPATSTPTGTPTPLPATATPTGTPTATVVPLPTPLFTVAPMLTDTPTIDWAMLMTNGIPQDAVTVVPTPTPGEAPASGEDAALPAQALAIGLLIVGLIVVVLLWGGFAYLATRRP